MFPAASRSVTAGLCNCAWFAGPPSGVEPLVPVPATVTTVPSLLILWTWWLVQSVM